MFLTVAVRYPLSSLELKASTALVQTSSIFWIMITTNTISLLFVLDVFRECSRSNTICLPQNSLELIKYSLNCRIETAHSLSSKYGNLFSRLFGISTYELQISVHLYRPIYLYRLLMMICFDNFQTYLIF